MEPWVDLALFRYSVKPDEGWDLGEWDQAHWDGGLSAEGDWTSIICDVRGIDIARGEQNVSVVGGVETGTLTFHLDNRDGQWSEFIDLGGGDFVPKLTSGVGVRVTSTDPLSGEVTWLFSGQIERWEQQWTDSDDVVKVTCSDDWYRYVQQATVPWMPGAIGQNVQQRMVSLLTRTGWSKFDPFMGQVYCQPGSTILIGGQSIVAAADSPDYPTTGVVETGLVVNSTVADEILQTALTDGGKAFLDADGAFVYLNRTWVNPGPIGTAPNVGSPANPVRPAQVQVDANGEVVPTGTIPLFGDFCGTPGSGELPYSDLEWFYDGTNVIGSIVVSNPAPPQTHLADGTLLPPAWKQVGQTVVGQGFPVVTMGDMRFHTQAEANAIAQHYISTYADNFIAVRRLQVYPGLDDRLWAICPKLRIGDHVRVLRREIQNTLDMEVVIEGIKLKITPQPERSVGGHHFGNWLFDYTTSEALVMISEGMVKEREMVMSDDQSA